MTASHRGVWAVVTDKSMLLTCSLSKTEILCCVPRWNHPNQCDVNHSIQCDLNFPLSHLVLVCFILFFCFFTFFFHELGLHAKNKYFQLLNSLERFSKIYFDALIMSTCM